MTREMRTLSFTKRSKARTLHIETELGIINIYRGLTDRNGHQVERVEILPDNPAPGYREVFCDGTFSTRLIEVISGKDED